MQYAYRSPNRPLWLGFGLVLGQPHAAYPPAGDRAFRVCVPLPPSLQGELELEDLGAVPVQDEDPWLEKDYRRHLEKASHE